MLSEHRRKLLASNKDRIRAEILRNNTTQECTNWYKDNNGHCMFEYSDGSMCAASACLTDEERNTVVNNNLNGCGIVHINQRCELNISKEEAETLYRFQNIHDVCCCNNADKRQFWNFYMTLKSLISTGKLSDKVFYEEISCVFNHLYELKDTGNYVRS